MAYGRDEEHAYKRFQRELKEGGMSGLVLLYGHENYLCDWALGELKKRYLSEAGLSMDFAELSASECSVDDVILACETLPFVSEKKLVYLYGFTPISGKKIKNFDGENFERFISYIAKLPDYALLVLSAGEVAERERPEQLKKLASLGRAYDFKVLSDKKLLGAFIDKRFRELGKKADPAVLKALVDTSGYLNEESDYDLYRMVNDIRKMAFYAGDKEVRPEDAEILVSGSLDSYVFHLTDALSSGRKSEALRLFSNAMQDTDEGEKNIFPLLGAIVAQYELMLDVKELSERGKSIAEMMKLLGKKSDFPIKKALRFSDKYGKKELLSALSALYAVDKNIKTGALGGRLAMELCLARI